MFSFLTRIFGSAQSRKISNHKKYISTINKKYEELISLSDNEWITYTDSLKERVRINKESLDSVLVDAYSAVKAAAFRIQKREFLVMGHLVKWNMVPYDEQILAGIAMYKESIAEMETGEGKTLTAAFPLYIRALTGESVFCLTINDYLAQRDAEWMRPLFAELGMTVGSLKNQQPHPEKKKAYACDIIYGTASEFGFDYLRDNSSVIEYNDIVSKKPFYFVLIDEIDHILISEAKTPLVISGPDKEPSKWFVGLRDIVEDIVKKHEVVCDKLINDAKEIFSANGWLNSRTEITNFISNEDLEIASQKLWLASKGVPEHRELLEMCEYGNIRHLINKWEVYFSYDHNKNEMREKLLGLYIVRDDKTKDFELTDTGMNIWREISDNENDDFEMRDIGYEIDEIEQRTDLSDDQKKELILKVYEEDGIMQERIVALKQLLHAYIITRKNHDYVVENGEVVLLDESTGRLQYGRRFSNGLHQAIEAKERIRVQKDSKTLASITIQNFIRMFPVKAGMSGTAITHESEFKEIYNLDVVKIPTHKPSRRIDLPDNIYVTKREKLLAMVRDIKNIHEEKRPILVGTYSIEEAEILDRMLSEEGVPHKLLSAKNHKLEADIVSRAGHFSSVTIATNMAGRGTDIKLASGVADIGGMHVMVSSRGKSRAQDLQFRGRQGRQGDPGSCQFYISFEDTILRTFQSPALAYVLKNYRPPEGEVLSSPLLSNAISTAQERLEHSAYQSRKVSLDYDDILNIQRTQIYDYRKDVIKSESISSIVRSIVERACAGIASKFYGSVKGVSWNGEDYRKYLISMLPISLDEGIFDKSYTESELAFDTAKIIVKELNMLEVRIKEAVHRINDKIVFNADRAIKRTIISRLDAEWRDHIEGLDELKQYVQIRAFGQKNPLDEYKKEAYKIFQDMESDFYARAMIDIFMVLLLEYQNVEKSISLFISQVEANKQASEKSNEAVLQ